MQYEVLFYRNSGAYSALCLANFASDRHAIASARRLMGEKLAAATVWRDGELVARLAREQPLPLSM
jgi:hypothetical protein